MTHHTEGKLVSILIVSWNVRELLADCLASLREAGLFSWCEVILVDNNSSDDTVSLVRRDFPEVTLLESGSNLGFSRGNNLAYRNATGKYIFLLNPDTVVPPGALEKLVGYLETHPETGAVGPKQLGRTGKTQFEAAVSLPTTWNVLCDWLLLSRCFPQSRLFANRKLGHWDHNSSRDIPAIAGSAMLMPRALIQQIGLLDETMFMIEDMDLCFRISCAGYKIHYLASSVITHYGGESLRRKNNPGLQLQIAFQSFWIYLRKNKGKLNAAFLTVVMFCWALIASAFAAVYCLLDPVSGRKWWSYASGLLAWTVSNKIDFEHPLATPLHKVRASIE